MKIGFIDYYLSEWHANNYPEWIKEKSEELKIPAEICYAWAEREDSLVDGVTTAEWCEKNKVICCESVKELCEKSDAVIILAPSNPEKHLPYAKEVFKYASGKPVYIDKTFASNYNEALEICEAAKASGIDFFSTSALRYANELSSIDNCKTIAATGSGRLLEEYIIHPIEMVVKSIGTGACSVTASGNDMMYSFAIKYNDERRANIIFGKELPFTVYMNNGEAAAFKTVESDFFKGLMADILTFFSTGKKSYETSELLEAMRLRDAILKARDCLGETVNI